MVWLWLQNFKIFTLFNKKHRNPLDTEIRKEYHVQNKTFKKLIKHKKQQFFYSKVNELISNENDHKFWDTLKSMKENNLSYYNNNNENPTNNSQHRPEVGISNKRVRR